MRELRFIVDGQAIKKDPGCNFTGIVAGTEGYLTAKFVFSSEWSGCVKVAQFFKNGKEYPMPITNGNKCVIPRQALTWDSFEVSIKGKRAGYTITTNRVRVTQSRR